MKKIIIKNISLLVILAGMVLPAYSQTTPLDVKVVNERIEKKGKSVTINLEFVLDDVSVRSNDMVIYTPIIVSTDNSDNRIELPPVVIAGNKRNKILERQQRLDGRISVETEPIVILKKERREHQTIAYSTTIAYSNWMQGAKLAVETVVFGCADCYEQADDLFVAENIIPKMEFPAFVLAYIEPGVEPVKARSDRHTATFNFVVDRYELLRDYKNNKSKFEEVDKVISEIAGNDDIIITEFSIAGYASPEASVPHNKVLAENRAKAFANYLMTKHNVSDDKFTVASFGEDWNGLQQAVEASSIADKAEILRIINSVDNMDARDVPLLKLSNGNTYRTLLNDFYPPLRRTEYSIAYQVRSFDVEEAKAIIKTNPKLLSLNEMYLVAHSYGANTPEFKEVFDIALRTYPDSEIAIMNSAAADIENNAIDKAITQLERMSDNLKAKNNLGVANALKGDLQKALRLFTEAAANNDTDAVGNLEKLKQYMEGLE